MSNNLKNRTEEFKKIIEASNSSFYSPLYEQKNRNNDYDDGYLINSSKFIQKTSIIYRDLLNLSTKLEKLSKSNFFNEF
jgi:hypothetical protein